VIAPDQGQVIADAYQAYRRSGGPLYWPEWWAANRAKYVAPTSLAWKLAEATAAPDEVELSIACPLCLTGPRSTGECDHLITLSNGRVAMSRPTWEALIAFKERRCDGCVHGHANNPGLNVWGWCDVPRGTWPTMYVGADLSCPSWEPR